MANEGAWGEVTASIDWCEENYAVSPYLAEYWNSLSSLVFCVLTLFQLWGMRSVPPLPRAAPSATHARLPSEDEEDTEKAQRIAREREMRPLVWEHRFYMGSVAFALVGIGSFLFHCTLWYSMQMADELPMTWVALLSVYSCYEHTPTQRMPALPRILWTYAVISTVWQLWLTRTFPIFHEIQFGVLMVYVAWSMWVYASSHQSFHIRLLLYLYIASFLVAFFGCWIPDQVFCAYWRSLGSRNPQLHAVWHVLMCVGSHFSFVLTQYRRAETLKQKPKFLTLCGVPYLVVLGGDSTE